MLKIMEDIYFCEGTQTIFQEEQKIRESNITHIIVAENTSLSTRYFKILKINFNG